MKKTLCFVLLLLIAFLVGCTNINDNNTTTSNEATQQETTLSTISPKEGVILPKVDVELTNLTQKVKNVNLDSFTIFDTIGDIYYGCRSKYTNSGIEDEFMLLNVQTQEEIKTNTPANTKPYVGSGSMVVLEDRYIYEWYAFDFDLAENGIYDVSLTRIDTQTGNVEIVDVLESKTPLIYMCKIDEKQLLTYRVSQAVDNWVISEAWIYDVNGCKKQIIRERYKNEEDWTDSEGMLISRFAIKDGEIYGLDRRRVSGEYIFSLYHFDKNGELLSEEAIDGLQEIIGTEQMLDLNLVGDYIAFRTYESFTTYICKKTNNGVKLVMKGQNQQVCYTATNRYIVFIENSVNVYNGQVENEDCPLYIIDAKNDKIYAAEFSTDLNKAYFVSITALSNGGLLFKYCNNGIFDPMKMEHYIIDMATLEKFFCDI